MLLRVIHSLDIGAIIAGFFTAVTAIATAFIARYTRTLQETTHAHISHNREVERAYVAGGGIRQTFQRNEPVAPRAPTIAAAIPQDDGSFIVIRPTGGFEVHVSNHGKTTARIHHFQWGFCDASIRPSLPILYGALVPLRDDIGPGVQSRPVMTVRIQGSFTRTAVFGRFHWYDIWGRYWSSGFIYEIPTGNVAQNGSLSIDAPQEYWADVDERNTTYP